MNGPGLLALIALIAGFCIFGFLVDPSENCEYPAPPSCLFAGKDSRPIDQ